MKLLRPLFYKWQTKKITKKYRGEEVRDKFDDRRVLEEIIFPNILAIRNPEKILDIGREEDQYFYNKFFINKEFWTLDINPDHKDFGAKNHIVDNATNLKKHFKDNYFDLIIINGVFGWGLNKKHDIEKTFSSIYDILKTSGILIFGWNDIEDLIPVPLNKIEALKKLNPYYFKPLKTDSFKCKTGEHTYNFYIK